MLPEGPHVNLAMKLQAGRQNHAKYSARNNRCNCVPHVHFIQHELRGLGIGLLRGERKALTKTLARSLVVSIDLAQRAGTDPDGSIGGGGALNRVGHVVVNQIADGHGTRRPRQVCRPALGGELDPLAGGGRKGQHHEPQVTPIDDVEGEPEQQRNGDSRFEQALPPLALGAASTGQFYVPHVYFSAARAATGTRSNSIVSPTNVEVESKMPEGSSSTAAAFQNIRVIRNGRRSRLMAITFQSPSRTAISMGKRIPQVCTPCEGTMSSPSPARSSRSPSRPTIRVNPVSATRMHWPTTVPRVAFVARTDFCCHRIALFNKIRKQLLHVENRW